MAEMRVASVCSGIGGAELAFHGIAHHAFAAEIEQFPRAVLAHHFPGMKLYGDFTEIPAAAGPVDVLVGGTPCQSFSVAGLRGGMADARGNLALEFLRLAERLRARWVLWENVPGVLSSSDGRDFGAFVGGLAELGYGWAYRVLDAQYFGLAQRRKRVFVVGCLGDWRRAAAVLFEPASLRGDTPPGRETREGIANALTERADRGGTNSEGQRLIAGTLASRATAGGGLGTDFDLDGGLIAASLRGNSWGDHAGDESKLVADTVRSHPRPGSNSFGNIAYGDVARCLNAHPSRIDGESETFITHSLRADGFDAGEDGTGRGTPLVAMETLQHQGYDAGDASAQETDAIATLRTLRDAVGAEAFAEWRSGILDSLQSPEVLRQAMHGRGIRRAARESGSCVDDSALSCAPCLPAGPLRQLWEEGPDGRSPQGLRLAEQLARQSGASVPWLSPQGTPQQGSSVRRLTPLEAERLQGFPDGWTEVEYRGKPAADGPRYRALGNAFAVPVVRWIARRIVQEVRHNG